TKYTSNPLKFNSQNKLARISNFKILSYANYYGGLLGSSLNLNAANLFERVRGMGWTGSTLSVDCVETARGITCTINPFAQEYDNHMYGSTSRIFVADFKGKTGAIVIGAKPAANSSTNPTGLRTSRANGFELYIFNCKNPDLLDERIISETPVSWPFNKPPCFSVDGITCDVSINFFEINNLYFATAKALNFGCTGATLFYNDCTKPDSKILQGKSLFTGSEYGACCKTDGTCVEILGELCTGYFHGNGTTCGTTFASICDKIGACCFDDNKGNKFCSETTSWECLAAGPINGQYKTKFSGNGTKCKNIDCDVVLEDKGACCDGKGSCYETTKEICTANSGFFQGKTTTCNQLGNFICMTGTGPCCIDGTCFVTNATSCFNQNGYFIGSGGVTCNDITCPTSVSCLGII
ncbi:hypothetical protein EBR77_04640, partial [bacterium]|nr:hypothetical protein [bacterium]